MCHISVTLNEDTTLLITEGLQIEARHHNNAFEFEIRGLKSIRQLIKGRVTDKSLIQSPHRMFVLHVTAWGFNMKIGVLSDERKFFLLTDTNKKYWAVNKKKIA